MKTCWIDLETTGIDENKHGVIQIAGMIIDQNGTELSSFNYPVKPLKGQMVSKDALEVTGKTIEEIREYPDAKEVYRSLMQTFSKVVDKYNKQDKMFFAGYNALFDWRFMYKFWENNQDNYFGSFFWFPPLDVAVIAGQHLVHKRHEMPNFKLATVAKTLGIAFDEGKTHDAFYDIMLTLKVYQAITTGGKPQH